MMTTLLAAAGQPNIKEELLIRQLEDYFPQTKC
jgi:hypothetical protein